MLGVVEVNKSRTEVLRKEMGSDQIVPRETEAWGELNWEKSDLAKFSKFLGFSTEGDQNSDIVGGLVRSLGSGRWSNWVAWMPWAMRRDAVCWDKRSLEVMETERLFVGRARAIRGLWEDPWCLGGDFNVILSQRERSRQGRLTGAMRSFAQTVDELELLDLPMQGGAFTWSGGRNNQSWARLDRGPTPFRFENMWLKVDDFKGLLRGWWQGIEVFGRLEVNKNSALQQVEYWDGVESERSLSIAETEQKKEAKDAFINGCLWKKSIGGRSQGSCG
ncbi:hypothetical protein CK203_098843 [Vitis vinifera]|uniref:Endonuclease/exonuclease/phosphatase domain-containing protein n=1 Tax=Vitis vinifera TaxID=29760 RepID=A0A438D4Y4_VITVI|nr:hypothetical protein CK203_098843 [Vitis vinifera]